MSPPPPYTELAGLANDDAQRRNAQAEQRMAEVRNQHRAALGIQGNPRASDYNEFYARPHPQAQPDIHRFAVPIAPLPRARRSQDRPREVRFEQPVVRSNPL
ncbi:hypothetical protein M422DRAFT_29314 [Sphaerobolus stellatus SS14]|uniref:Unplaced genomic scaffold SPHSTscaffold_492, whole genome shotgun sequence n=1 Tax=Sphaerobolus stellatus (strain SS14) TaxID=990650 RepID=A0A0C9TPP4_SPHS4|nr:hypothetical protein M422DRAFT_39385 [Sphaerobolus stellatus SS14]KIJ46480.1 hypothetical protein M422DRAFT_29314 [Sphaerobolus stellatus SS14]